MQNQQGVFNRIDNNVINWQFVESVDYDNVGNTVYINYVSGNVKEINDSTQVLKFLEFIQVFPDIMNDQIRNMMIQASQQNMTGVRTDMYQGQQNPYDVVSQQMHDPQIDNPEMLRRKRNNIRTDIK